MTLSRSLTRTVLLAAALPLSLTACAKGSSSNVSKVQQLRDAAKRIGADTNLSEETRARIALAINEAIARLPASE